MMRLLSRLWLVLSLLWLPVSAWAQLQLTLTASASGTQGGVATFQASVKNTGTSTVYLNQLSVTADQSSDLDVDPSAFYNGFEGALAAGASVTSRTMFTVPIDPTAAPGSFPLAVRILGGADADALGNLAQKTVTVVVTANGGAPETYLINGPAEGSQTGAPEIQFSFAGSDSDTPSQRLRFKWRMDAQAWQGPSSSTVTTVKNLAIGFHTFTVAAVDEAGVEDLSPVVRTFEVVKPKVLIAAPDQPTFRLDPTVAQELTIRVTNLGRTNLTGIQAAVTGASANIQVTLTGVPTTLFPMASADVTVRVLATDQTVLSSKPLLRFTSAEGEEATANLNCTVVPRLPKLVLNPASLSAAMLRGQQTVLEAEVTNEGSVAAQDVRVNLPGAPWLTLITPQIIPTLEPGQKAKVGLSLLPQNTMTLGPYSGSIAINLANGNGLSLPFTFNLISDQKGTLKIISEDEYTYFATGTPNLGGATVVIKDRFTGDVIAQGTTDTTSGPTLGTLTLPNLMEGFYNVEVSANGHGAFKGAVEVVAGETKTYKAFLPRQFVQYKWSVVPVDTVDLYQVTLDATFETNVPAPVLTMSPAFLDLRTLDYDENGKAVVYFTLTNHGLIALNDLRISLPTGNDYKVTAPLTEFGTLAALKTITVPVTIERAQVQGAFVDCDLTIGACALYICDIFRSQCVSSTLHAKTCFDFGEPSGPIIPPYYPFGFSVPKIDPEITNDKTVNCEKCILALLKNRFCIDQCFDVPDFTKIVNCVNGFTDCVNALGTPDAGFNCLSALWSCGLSDLICNGGGFATKAACCIISMTFCMTDVIKACQSAEGLQIALDGGVTYRSTVSCATPGAHKGARAFQGGIGRIEILAERNFTVSEFYGEFLGGANWFQGGTDDRDVVFEWLAAYVHATDPQGQSGIRIDAAEADTLRALPIPSTVSAADVDRAIARWNRTLDYHARGIFYSTDLPTGEDPNFVAGDRLQARAEAVQSALLRTQEEGYTNIAAAILAEINQRIANSNQDGVCARVKVRVNQDIAITRSVFEGELEISNTSADIVLSGLKVTLNFRDEAGIESTERFAQLGPNVTGISALNGTADLLPGQTATGTWKITPLRDAAPTADTKYFVGGTIEYLQDGTNVSLPIFPAPITVKPDPFLFLHYFWQRDVYSDDPFTPLTERSEPFALGLLVVNSGYGTARNMTIASSKPQIIENEKGLLIDFNLLGSRIDDNTFLPGLNAELGDIPPVSTRTATWFLTSTLQGQFISYNATLKHITELGDPRASLIDGVAIHELEHVVRIEAGDDHKPDYLANDDQDAAKLPDKLYSSTGETFPVEVELNGVVSGGTVNADNLTVTLALPAAHTGWTYIRLDDPGQGRYPIAQVLRADGSPVRLRDNVWQTSRTKRLGGVATRENRLYIFDKDPTSSYTLVYRLPDPRYGSAGGLKTQADATPVSFGRQPGGGGSGGSGGDAGDGWNPGDPNVGGESNTGGQTTLIATGNFGSFVYAETEDRSSGIKIQLPGGAPLIREGDAVYGLGVIRTDVNGERYIDAQSIAVSGVGRVEAIGMTTRSLYGADFFVDANGVGQRGMKDGNGLNAIGMLLRTLGRVTQVGSGFFRIDDGYGRPVKVLLPALATPPNVGAMVDVAGILCPESLGGDLYPVVRPRSIDDLRYATGPLTLPAPARTLARGDNLFALPGVPNAPEPTSVLSAISTNPASLAGRLNRYDAPTQQEIFYQVGDPLFGLFLSNDGYRFRIDAGEETGAARFSFTGYGTDFADAWVSLPRLGATRIGAAFPFSVPWESLLATDGIETRSLRAAARSVPPWLDSVAQFWDNGVQGARFLGLPEDGKDSTLLEPWRGYWVTSSRGNVALIAPTLGRPVIEQLAPNGAQAGGSGIRMVVTGTGFRTGSVVLWNGMPRPTTYLSSTRLRVDIAAADLAQEQVAAVSVASPAKVSAPASAPEVSASRPFYVTRAPRIVLTDVGPAARVNNVITLTVTLMNQGGLSAPSLRLTSASLGAANANAPLPGAATLAPGASTTLTLSFPSNAGASGASVLLRLGGVYGGGSFTASRRMTLP